MRGSVSAYGVDSVSRRGLREAPTARERDHVPVPRPREPQVEAAWAKCFSADDTQLSRKVAIKFLAEALEADENRSGTAPSRGPVGCGARPPLRVQDPRIDRPRRSHRHCDGARHRRNAPGPPAPRAALTEGRRWRSPARWRRRSMKPIKRSRRAPRSEAVQRDAHQCKAT